MRFFKSVVSVFRFSERVNNARIKYDGYGKPGRIYLTILEYLAVFVSIGSAYGTNVLFEQVNSNLFYYILGIIVGIFSVVCSLYTLSSCIVSSIISFTANKRQQIFKKKMDQIEDAKTESQEVYEDIVSSVRLKSNFKDKLQVKQTSKTFEIIIGILHVVAAVLLVVGVVVVSLI